MEQLNNLEQAKHNESVCIYLYKKNQYSDWVVTTAFYSAVHYTRHLFLPLNEGGLTYNTFDSLFKQKKGTMEGRHGFQSRLVLELCPDVAFQYNKLHDMSNNARYSNYVYSRDEANLAKKYLEDIKIHVLNVKSE